MIVQLHEPKPHVVIQELDIGSGQTLNFASLSLDDARTLCNTLAEILVKVDRGGA